MEQSDYDRLLSTFETMADGIIRLLTAVDEDAAASGAVAALPRFADFGSPGEREAAVEHEKHTGEIEAIRARLVAAIRRPWDDL